MTMGNKSLNPKLLSMFGMGGSVFGFTLPELFKKRQDILVLSADMSSPAGLDKFKTSYPDSFINVGIAEQNMIGMAAGLSDMGYKCICVAQSSFITMRDYEMVRQFCGYMKIPLVLIGISGGLSLTFMGNTHYALEDIALMRTIPGMKVIAPCDALEAAKAFEQAVSIDEPVYIRLQGGAGWPAVHKEDFDFKIGTAIKMRDGKDAQVISTGSVVGSSLKAAELLAEEGIQIEVIDMHTIQPLDTDIINLDNDKVFTVEEHRCIGGLGDAVASYLAQNQKSPRLVKISADEVFPQVGDYDYLLEQCGLLPNQIADKIKTEIKG